MDVLVALGSSVAYFYSVIITLGLLGGHVYFETSASIITLVMTGKLMESIAKGRTSAAIKKLIGLRAKTARVIRNGAEIDIPVEDARGRIVRLSARREDPGRRRGDRRAQRGGREHDHR